MKENAIKTSGRTDRNLFVVLSISTKISSISKQIVPSLLSIKLRTVHVKVAMTLQKYPKEEVHSVIQFLSAKGLNSSDICCEISVHMVMSACAKLKSTLGF